MVPPKRLVVVGFYRYVRNPMYVGFAAGWIGLWVVFGHPNPLVIAAVAAVALGVHLFVVFYEEPTLRKKFGTEYEEYSRNVQALVAASARLGPVVMPIAFWQLNRFHTGGGPRLPVGRVPVRPSALAIRDRSAEQV